MNIPDSKYGHLFIFRSWKISKHLTILFVIFIAGQIFFSYKGVETFPFNNYGMYSHRYPKKDSLQIITFHTASGPEKGINDFSEGYLVLNQSFRGYYSMVRNNNQDSLGVLIDERFENILPENLFHHIKISLINQDDDIFAHPGWMKNYFEKLYGEKLNRIMLNTVYYNEINKVELMDSDTLWHEE